MYKLYDEYGYSVASLYSLGFFTGGVLSLITGPWVDKMGRKRAAILYCILEILINTTEQCPSIRCLIGSRMLGGLTTNLLQCVFETWLDSEFRDHVEKELQIYKFNSSKERNEFIKSRDHSYELFLRDGVIVSNAAAIGSGYLSHVLSAWAGPVGPFRGAVVCTTVALIAVLVLWTENYGGGEQRQSQLSQNFDFERTSCDEKMTNCVSGRQQSIFEFLKEATRFFMTDAKMLCVGIVQGLSVGSLHIFVFLWSPVLMQMAKKVPPGDIVKTFGLDRQGEPAFGIIFMVFMCACVLGGILAPFLRRIATSIMLPTTVDPGPNEAGQLVRPMAVEFLSASCYFLAACMLLVPCMVSGPKSFSRSLVAFSLYELLVGIVSPCEGVIRSIYFPAHARASVWTLPSVLVNSAVSLAVFCTQFVSLLTVCCVVVSLMTAAAILQASMITSG